MLNSLNPAPGLSDLSKNFYHLSSKHLKLQSIGMEQDVFAFKTIGYPVVLWACMPPELEILV